MGKKEFCIALCDDQEECILSMKQMIEVYFCSIEAEYQIYQFHSGEELLEACRDNSISVIHLLFLDIEMKGISGIEVKNQLSRIKMVKRLVFVTSHDEAMSMAFGMKVIGFMKKPVLYEQMVRWIQVARKELEEICITYESDSGPNVIEEEKILFIQAAGDYTYLYQVERKEPELVTHSVKYWENLLSQGSFVRVHKSFFVNLRYIMQIENNTIMLDGGREKLPIGRVYKKQVEERFHAYIIETIRNRVQ